MNITPYSVTNGKATAIKIGEEVLETPPIPVENLVSISDVANEYLSARKEFEASRQSFVLIETRFLNTKEKLEIVLHKASGAGTTGTEARPTLTIHSPFAQEEPQNPLDTAVHLADGFGNLNARCGYKHSTGSEGLIITSLSSTVTCPKCLEIIKQPEPKKAQVEASMEDAVKEQKTFEEQVLGKKEVDKIPTNDEPHPTIKAGVPQKPTGELAREIYPEVVRALKEKHTQENKGKDREKHPFVYTAFNEAELHVQLSSMGVPDEQVKEIAEMTINELLETKQASKKHKLFNFKKEVVFKEEKKEV